MKIECVDLTKSIRRNPILQHIQFTFESGKVYGLQGKNGSGKTMLIRAICGLITPTSGKVLYNDQELGKDLEFPPSVGLLLENPSFLGEYSGLKNLQHLASINRRITDEEIRQAIVSVGLDPDDKKKYRKYSLGMKQKLGIAAAVMEKPELVILDEPTNALDTAGIDLVRNIVTNLRDRNRLIIIASHDHDELRALADEILVLEAGSLKEVIPVAERSF